MSTSTQHTYEFEDGVVTATFERDGAVMPEDAVAAITNAVEQAGGVVWQEFVPCEQMRKGDPGYIGVDLRIDFPGLAPFWIELECPTDEAFSGDD